MTRGRLSRVLGLVGCLISFGRGLAETLRQTTDADFEFRYRAHLFGTNDLAVMLARIARGLRRAAALETFLLARAQRGRDLKVAPVRMGAACAPSSEPRTARPKRSSLPLAPSDDEIAADIRRRPVGAVLVDICHDLGMQPGDLAHDMHRELMNAVMFYGGNPLRLLRLDEGMRRDKQYLAMMRSDAPLPPDLHPRPYQQAVTTGPP